ncbi:unnamed protein product [Protopolystoma xenopodis]|uniref:SH3 domain-containing protein n=1 Tax=Protopolystoma xenopodis TaxID=117903 RepID=A0A3S5AZH1_9PLAT|nr:unnamed protein product [Protopolystoma xenopodis]
MKVLYAFDAQCDGEMSVSIGEILTIIDQDVGAGWWQAKNQSGSEGLVPSSFLEVVYLPEPDVPPPPPPPASQRAGSVYTKPEDDWDDDWADSDEETAHNARPVSKILKFT